MRSSGTKYANEDDFLSGDGAAKYGGRWNRRRIHAVYTSLDIITATYEAYQDFLDYGICRGPIAGKYPKSVATTWAVTYQELADAQRDVLCVSAYLAPKRIPFELFTEGRSELGDAIGEALAEVDLVPELLEPLHRVSLISLDSVDESYSVHRLVQEVTKDALDAEFSRMWAERAVRAINRTIPDVELASWPRYERLVPNALLASRMIAEHDLASSQAARMLNQTALYLKEREQYSVALPLFKQALEIRRKVLGESTPISPPACGGLRSWNNERAITTRHRGCTGRSWKYTRLLSGRTTQTRRPLATTTSGFSKSVATTTDASPTQKSWTNTLSLR